MFVFHIKIAIFRSNSAVLYIKDAILFSSAVLHINRMRFHSNIAVLHIKTAILHTQNGSTAH
uniref:Uncharacterized protein n=1 Tax=Octopus bimaculoides TaxID=37653 RepID=A0A0L8G6P7_OCTBM